MDADGRAAMRELYEAVSSLAFESTLRPEMKFSRPAGRSWPVDDAIALAMHAKKEGSLARFRQARAPYEMRMTVAQAMRHRAREIDAYTALYLLQQSK